MEVAPLANKYFYGVDANSVYGHEAAEATIATRSQESLHKDIARLRSGVVCRTH